MRNNEKLMARGAIFACLLGIGFLSPLSAGEFPEADQVVVEKGARKLHLMQNGTSFRTFDIALGIQPDGDKEREGDFRTPEGRSGEHFQVLAVYGKAGAECGVCKQSIKKITQGQRSTFFCPVCQR